MDNHDKDFITVVANFDGPDGAIIVDNVWVTAGECQTEQGEYLYITASADIFGIEQPEVYDIGRG